MKDESTDRQLYSKEERERFLSMLVDLEVLSGSAGKDDVRPDTLNIGPLITVLEEFPRSQLTDQEIRETESLWESEEKAERDRLRRRTVKRWVLTVGIAASALVAVAGITAKMNSIRSGGEANPAGEEERVAETTPREGGGSRAAGWPTTDVWDRRRSDVSSGETLATSTEELLLLAELREAESGIDEAEEDLATFFLGTYVETPEWDETPNSRDGDLFLRLVKSDLVKGPVRTAVARALRSFPEKRQELARLLVKSSDRDLVIDLLLGLPVGEAVNDLDETIVRMISSRIDHSSSVVRRAVTFKLDGYRDPEGFLGQIYLERISEEGDIQVLEHIVGSIALENAVKESRELPDKIREIVRGADLLRGGWESEVARRTRAQAWKVLAIVDLPLASTSLLELLRTDRLVARELIVIILGEPEILQAMLRTHGTEIYEVFGQLLHDGSVDSHLLLTGLLKANGAKAIADLAEISNTEARYLISVDQMLLCDEELFSTPLDGLENYLIEMLEGYNGRAGEELAGLCHLFVRLGTEPIEQALRSAVKNSRLSQLARQQLLLASIQIDPDGFAGDEIVLDFVEAILSSLRNSDPDEALAILSGLSPLPSVLRRTDVIDALVSLVERRPSGLPAFPFVGIQMLYSLRRDGFHIERDLGSLSDPFRNHADWRVRLATVLARLDGGDGQDDEIRAVVESHRRVLASDGRRSGVLTDVDLANLRARIARIRPYQMRRVSPGNIDPEKIRLRDFLHCTQLEERIDRLEESRRSALLILEDVIDSRPSIALQRSVLALASRMRTPEIPPVLARRLSVIRDKKPEHHDVAQSGPALRSSLFDELEKTIRNRLASLRNE